MKKMLLKLLLNKLSDNEVKTFMHMAFEQANIKVNPEAMDIMVHSSSGLPILMHEIGDATFWIDSDGIIDSIDALNGVFAAAEQVGKKYLDPKVYRAVRSERYRSILRRFGDLQIISSEFRKKDVEAKLTDTEKKVFHNFLRKMRDLGVIESDVEKGKGAYRFVNEIYPIYIGMESERFKSVRNNTLL